MSKDIIIQKLNRLRYFLIGGTCAAAISFAAVQLWADAETKDRPEVNLHVDDRPLERQSGAITSFAPVVKKASPSVVKVFSTIKGKEVQMQRHPFMQDPFWNRFFPSPEEDQRSYRTPDRAGLGSGVIVTEDGYILTNNHVVQNADEVKVALADNREFDAEVVGLDPKSDIAVLKIDAKDLPAMTLGDSEKIEIGDLVLAIGNPFGVGQTTTMGLVSATGRANVGLEYEDFIQTDAAINPGNSGGALVDVQGRLIGINTAILSRSGGNNGIGFAVPINMARDVMESLVEHGRVIRGFLGVRIQDMNPELAQAFDLDQPRGALVSEVTPRSPADKAGIKDGDVIVGFDGKQIKDSRHLKLTVGATDPERDVPVQVVRDGDLQELSVKLGELSEDVQFARAEATPDETDRLKGVAVSDLDTTTRRQMNLPENLKGAMVTEVAPDSAAYEAGLRSGNIILEIDRKPVKSASDAIEITEDLKKDRILLRVWADGGSRFLVVNETE